MPESLPPIEERLACAREVAQALVLYFARHCSGGDDEKASAAYAEVVKALSADDAKADEEALSGAPGRVSQARRAGRFPPTGCMAGAFSTRRGRRSHCARD